ncbi:hypothetical protein P4K49_26090 [Bacillus cereus]|uniref:hypothetical protein n=1 Tax=Bacillus cereus group TaxID=86661 RepID=UPI0002411FDA|nr:MULTISPECIES: hypothetical protein [Bacillus cereus group]AKR38649.1 Hypothetical protein NF53_p3087 [Bacillus thuringiensis serovar indiana]EHL65852.1 hypothetical protein HMPREF1014_05432 [Bacillus sp. 7_6_55CFAA_CT2]EJQ14768.1 hypothetical protein IE5_05731 [Bacillus cereus BAG3X2-2]MDA2655915.1 hypothetical protein [Bacillus cereus]MEB8878426.1 hypothetical protein [Bacillus cereus]
MNKVLSLITILALSGGFLFAPSDSQKKQPQQLAKDTQLTITLKMSDPGTGV